MEIKYLRLVKNIVELGSMAKSKDKLCLTQSALSHQLKEAEQQAGTALFVRSNKRLIPTPAGELVYNTALEVLTTIEKLETNMQKFATGRKGVIRLTTACYTNYSWLPNLIKRFSSLHPNVEIKIIPEYINEAIPRLKSHDLDAVITTKPELCNSIQFFELLNDELVAIVAPGHEWEKKKYVTSSDFQGKNLIIFSKPMETVVVYNKVLKPNGTEPLHIYEVPMSEAMVEMVISDMGVAVIPYWIAQPYILAGKIVPVRVTAKGLFRSLGIALREKESYPAYYKTLIEYLKENLVKTPNNSYISSSQ
jgi:LysR family transcriptional regulator, regulator for metE and metH